MSKETREVLRSSHEVLHVHFCPATGRAEVVYVAKRPFRKNSIRCCVLYIRYSLSLLIIQNDNVI